MEKLKPPAIELLGYGGGRLNIVGQMKVCVGRAPATEEFVVQVQRHGTVPLLIGTDLQPKLGFALVQYGPTGKVYDLLSGGETDVKPIGGEVPSLVRENTDAPGAGACQANVHLIKAVRLTPR